MSRRTGRVRLLTGCLFAILSLVPPALLAGSVPEDLDLDRALSFEILAESGPNPHDTFPCERCHEKTDVTYEMARKYALEIPLTTEGDSSMLLCEECHDPLPHFFHPVSFRVDVMAERIEK